MRRAIDDRTPPVEIAIELVGVFELPDAELEF
jgi:hypothetical protein